MKVSKSAYYDWCKRPGKLIDAQELRLRRRIKALFKASRSSLGSREMMKALRAEGFKIGRYRVRRLMSRLGLSVTQRVAYKVTTKRKHSDSVADNLLNQNFNPVGPNQIWAGDVGACWYNAVVERFFGSLKHDWLFKVSQPTREHMKNDVAA